MTSAPSATFTQPPFSTISVAVPPAETNRQPVSFTMVEFAEPPLVTDSLPPELTAYPEMKASFTSKAEPAEVP